MVSMQDTLRAGLRAGCSQHAANARNRSIWRALCNVFMLAMLATPLLAQSEAGGEANLKLPDLGMATFLGGINGHNLLIGGLVVSALGLVFGLIIFMRLQEHAGASSMREVSELIYETCKTYLATQGKFLMLLECFIAVIIVFYFGLLQGDSRLTRS